MKTYKFKLYSNKKLKNLEEKINLSGRAYNYSVSMSKRYYSLFGKTLNHQKLQKHMTFKKDLFEKQIGSLMNKVDSGEIEFEEFDFNTNKLYWKYGFMCDIPSQALQQITERMKNSYKLFFENRKRGIKASPPGFQSSRKYPSFTLKQAGWRYEENELVPKSLSNKVKFKDNKIKIGNVNYKFHKTQSVVGEIKTVTIKRDTRGGFFICFACKLSQEPVMKGIDFKSPKKAKAIDFGLKDFLVFDDGVKISSPEFLKRSLKELRVLSRKHSKKAKGSNNRLRSAIALAKLHERIANQRLDWARQIAHKICKSFGGISGFIFIEDLNLRGMKKLWGRKVSDLAYGQFISELTRISIQYGIEVVKIGRYEKSTGVCSETGLLKQLTLADRSWDCDCGHTHDRDVESAKTILKAGLGLVRKVP